MLQKIKPFLRPAVGRNPLRYVAWQIVRAGGCLRYDKRIQLGMVDRPHYAYCVYHGAQLGKRLGLKRVSVLEFGVAGGRGLMNLEQHKLHISKLLGVEIDIYGFDTGQGLPAPSDYRDLPYHWKEGQFRMDVPKLKSELKSSKLVLGNVEDTVKTFFAEHQPAPIAAVMFDLDYYSSSISAFKLFDGPDSHFLPRVYCYFDDMTGSEVELYNDFSGVRLAIKEFNDLHNMKKFSKSYHLVAHPATELWRDQIYTYHNFAHSRYNAYVSMDDQQLPL